MDYEGQSKEQICDQLGALRTKHDRLKLQLEALGKVHAALIRSEHRYRVMSEASFEGVAFLSKDIISDLNEQLSEMLGYHHDQLIGMPVSSVVAHESRDLVSEAVRSNRTEPYEFLALRRDGSTFPVEGRNRIALVGDKLQSLMVFRDIAGRKKAEEALLLSEERLRLALEGTTDGIWDWDFNTGNAYFSPQYYMMLGYEPDEFESSYESWQKLIHPDDVEVSEIAIRRAIEKRVPYAVEFRMKSKTGNWIWILGRGKVVTEDSEGNPVRLAGSHADITARKQIEEALEKRIVALTKPMDSATGIALEDLFQLSEIQRLQDLFADALGVAGLITHPDGTPITLPSNFTTLCGEMIRKSPKGLEMCKQSDATIGRHNPSGPTIQNCLSAGLCNAGASITLGGHHVANWLIGQVRNEDQDEQQIMKYCHEIGAEEAGFRTAYRAVPFMKQEQFEKVARLLFAVANQISMSAYQNVQQARFIADRNRAEEVSRKHMQELEAITRIGREMGSKLELHDIAEVGLRELVSFLKCDAAILFLQKDNRLFFESSVSLSLEPPMVEFPIHQIGECLCGLCIQQRAPLFSLNINEDPRCTWGECKAAGLTSVSAIPLLSGNEIIGVLCLGSQKERDFSQEINFIQSLQHELTMALKNSLLFEQIRNHGLELEKKLSELKRSNEERDSLQNQLVQAQKMEAVGILSGGIAHDFNNLLQIIQGYADLLLYRIKPEYKEHEQVREIKKASQQAAELIAGLLTFSRRIESKLRPTDVNREIRRIVEMLKRTIPKMIDIDMSLEEDVYTINADPLQLQQVLMNLAVNARDAMPEGGRIMIESRNLTLDHDYCRTHLGTKPGNYVLLTVSDTGSGMDFVTQKRIFDPFFTTKEAGKGTGLGLSVAYGIIKSHGGQILCYSEPGLGTAFKIYFPALTSQSEIIYDTIEEELPRRGTEKILIVDDEDMVREALAETLCSFGYNVLTAKDGKQGIEIFREKKAEIDLVILDLIMPEMSGTKTLVHILEIEPSAKVIISSGYSVNGQLDEALKSGAIANIGKPYEAKQLLALVRRVLDSE